MKKKSTEAPVKMKPENIAEALENFIRALNGIQFFTQKFTKKIHLYSWYHHYFTLYVLIYSSEKLRLNW